MIPWRETFSFCSLSVGITALNPRLNFDDALAGNNLRACGPSSRECARLGRGGVKVVRGSKVSKDFSDLSEYSESTENNRRPGRAPSQAPLLLRDMEVFRQPLLLRDVGRHSSSPYCYALHLKTEL